LAIAARFTAPDLNGYYENFSWDFSVTRIFLVILTGQDNLGEIKRKK